MLRKETSQKNKFLPIAIVFVFAAKTVFFADAKIALAEENPETTLVLDTPPFEPITRFFGDTVVNRVLVLKDLATSGSDKVSNGVYTVGNGVISSVQQVASVGEAVADAAHAFYCTVSGWLGVDCGEKTTPSVEAPKNVNVNIDVTTPPVINRKDDDVAEVRTDVRKEYNSSDDDSTSNNSNIINQTVIVNGVTEAELERRLALFRNSLDLSSGVTIINKSVEGSRISTDRIYEDMSETADEAAEDAVTGGNLSFTGINGTFSGDVAITGALNVTGTTTLSGPLSVGGSAGDVGYVLQSTGTGAQWVATSTLGIVGGGGGGGTWGSITGTLSSQTDLQTALDAKLATSTAASTYVPKTFTLNGLDFSANQTFATGTTGTDFNIVSTGSTHTLHLPSASGTNRGLLTSADWTTFNNKLTANSAITGATKTKITYDTNGLVTAGADATTADINDSADRRYVTDVQATLLGAITSSADELNILDGATLTTTELNYVDGVTSAIQTQLDGKLSSVNNLNPIQVGNGNTASGTYASAFGYCSTASSINSVVVGRSNFSGAAPTSVSIGILNNQSGGVINDSTGVITGSPTATTTACISSAVGICNIASGCKSNAFGFKNTSSGSYSSAFGYENISSGTFSTVFGMGSCGTANSATALGRANIASGIQSSAMGVSNTASSCRATASGYFNTVSGCYAAAFGTSNTASTMNSLALGRSNFVGTGDASVSIGILNNATVGTFNTTTGVISGTAPAVVAAGDVSATVGIRNCTSGCFGSTFGYLNVTSGTHAIAAGSTNTVAGLCSSAFGYKNTASGCRSSAFGFCNTVTAGDRGTASGSYNTASATTSVAIGHTNFATSCCSVAVGMTNSACIGSVAVAFGIGSRAQASTTVALGINAYACGSDSVAVGSSVIASGSISTAMGRINTASANYTSAVGVRNCATHEKSSAFGFCSYAAGLCSVAFGFCATTSNTLASAFGSCLENTTANSVEIGVSNFDKLQISSSGVNFVTSGGGGFCVNGTPVGGGSFDADALDPIEVGYGNTATTGNQSSAIGFTNTASAQYASAIGAGNSASASSASAFGYSNNATGPRASAFGYGNTASGYYSVAIGYCNEATQAHSSASGYGSRACGAYSSAVGYCNTAWGAAAAVGGYRNTGDTCYTSAFGYWNTASACYSSSVGAQNNVNTYGLYSSAFGYSNQISASAASAFGYSNQVSAASASAFGSSLVNNVTYSTKVGPADVASLHICCTGASSAAFQFNGMTDGTLSLSGGVLTSSSDERLKNIQGNFTKGLEAIVGITPIDYTWKTTTPYDHETIYSGFSAQNILEVIPSAISVGRDGMYGLNDRPILAASINAIKELNTKALGIDAITLQNTAAITSLNELLGLEGLSATAIARFEKLDLDIADVYVMLSEQADDVAALSDRLDVLMTQFESFSATVYEGVVTFVDVIAKRITASEIIINNEENPEKTGLIIYDRKTGEPICVYFENGEMKTQEGECEEVEGDDVTDGQDTADVDDNNPDENSDDTTTDIEGGGDIVDDTTDDTSTDSEPVDDTESDNPVTDEGDATDESDTEGDTPTDSSVDSGSENNAGTDSDTSDSGASDADTSTSDAGSDSSSDTGGDSNSASSGGDFSAAATE